MLDYKNILAYQPILTSNIISIVDKLQDGSLTKQMFHNKKSYAKRTGNLLLVLEYTIAFEIVNVMEKN